MPCHLREQQVREAVERAKRDAKKRAAELRAQGREEYARKIERQNNIEERSVARSELRNMLRDGKISPVKYTGLMAEIDECELNEISGGKVALTHSHGGAEHSHDGGA